MGFSQNKSRFHDELKMTMDDLTHSIYDITLSFPKDEQFGLISQIRRAAVSVILNYIEGFARRKKNVMVNFLEISYGSLKETKYLLYFSYKRKYINKEKYKETISKAD